MSGKKQAEIQRLQGLLRRIVMECKAGALDYDEVPKGLITEAMDVLGIDPDSLPPIILGAGDRGLW